jgi:outer membrane receptor protein involved in Fe transport
MEISAFYKPASYLSLYANASYLFENRKGFEAKYQINSPDFTEVEEISIDNSLISPRSLFHWGINYSFLNYFTANLDFSYYAKRKLPKNPYYQRSGTISPYLMVDFNLFLKHLINDRLEMSLKVRNAFNSDYHTRGSYSVIDGAGRGVFFSLEYKF